jgi:hypothetical protein
MIAAGGISKALTLHHRGAVRLCVPNGAAPDAAPRRQRGPSRDPSAQGSHDER